ncbi:MAG TPA: OB-fold domain-containing protein, partial [Acidimicrobiales bacterium]|nr:OB-fold domain-containing protein [Acidimicrobiales bacterium]
VTELRTIETKLEFPYSRTLGPVMGAFLMGLREGKVLGIKASDGRVIVPPVEYDPETGDALGPDLVAVGPGGTVEAWTWVDEPSPKHPIRRSFAFALVKPDGADTALVSPVDAGSIDAMSKGMRVTARFDPEPHGLITDLTWEPAKS